MLDLLSSRVLDHMSVIAASLSQCEHMKYAIFLKIEWNDHEKTEEGKNYFLTTTNCIFSDLNNSKLNIDFAHFSEVKNC